MPYRKQAATKPWGVSLCVVLAVSVSACSSLKTPSPSTGHLKAEPQAAPARDIPSPVTATVSLSPPKPAAKVETYSVSVRNIPVHDLLFALARDASLNVDIHPGIQGAITLNAIDQTLQQILTRISKQNDMRWEIDGKTLMVMPDSPFLRTYRIDYVNMARDVSGNMQVTSQISATTSGTGGGSGAGGGGATRIESTAKNRFWETLEKNLKDILRETDKILPEGSSETVIERSDQQNTTGTGAQQASSQNRSSSAQSQTSIAASPNPASVQQSGTSVVRRTTFREAASVIASPETGILTVRATGRQHEKIQEFLDQIMASARRQVLIEATIAEVNLSQNYQQGIDWQRIRRSGVGFSLTQTAPGLLQSTAATGAALSGADQVPSGAIASASGSTASGSLFVMGYKSPAQTAVDFAAAVKLLESFGNVKVLSSPKLSVLNNQTALLKVVNNIVYFNVKADTTQSSSGLAQTTVSTTPQSVSVGLVMSVTPQISENDSVVLNVRPMISRITGYKNDPNPSIAAVGLTNPVPEIQTREMESVLRVSNGEMAVLGGMMQDSADNKDDGVPGLSRIPGIGSLFSYKNETNSKTELVIFLRPVVIRDPSLSGDFQSFGSSLPDSKFLQRSWQPVPLDEERRK